MTSLQSIPGLAGQAGGARAPGLGACNCSSSGLAAAGTRCVCRNVRPCGGDSTRDGQRLNGAVPSSSFLPACNYCTNAQSGIVGVYVYTQAIVQDLRGREQNADLHCKYPGQIWA